jgi:heme exporter protein D
VDNHTAATILAKVRAKRAAATPGAAFADAVRGMTNAQVKSDALRDVGNLGMVSAGVGAAGAGLAGLVNLLKRVKQKPPRSGPALLPLPYPVEPAEMPAKMKFGSFLGGDAATSKAGLPWYGPAMVGVGVAGLGAGWKGIESLLAARRQRETDTELDSARREFHDALLAQYDKPLPAHPALAAEAPLRKAGRALDAAYDKFEDALAGGEKRAVDWGNAGGAALGGYGVYAGLSGLMTGAFVLDKMKKRSRRAILEKALQRRQRRQFMQQPTEIYAVPEPVAGSPARPGFRQEMKTLAQPPDAPPTAEI